MSDRIGIFVVDDVPELRELTKLHIEDDERLYVVGEAGDGYGALGGIAREQPDVVLLDLALPGMDGLEVLPRIRALSPRSEVVVFSGFSADRMEEPARQAGAAAYIEKGAAPDVLRAAILRAGLRGEEARVPDG